MIIPGTSPWYSFRSSVLYTTYFKTHIAIKQTAKLNTPFTFSETCIVIHICEKDQQHAHFPSLCISRCWHVRNDCLSD